MHPLLTSFYIIGRLTVQPPTQDTLKFVSVVSRHGDRTPIFPVESYPKDPYINHKFSNVSYSILTESGKQRAYRLGTYLKTTYSKFLNNKFTPYTVETRSTNANRTKETLNFILKALNPDITFPNIITRPVLDDSLLLLCDQFVLDYLNNQNTIAQAYPFLTKIKTTLSENSGKNITNIMDIYSMYTLLETEEYLNLALPDWTRNLYPDGVLESRAALAYEYLVRERNGGMLIKKFIHDMLAVKNGEMGKKLFLYSAHDITVVAVLKALGVFMPHVPKFSSAVILEMHQIKGDYFVKVVYYLGVPEETIDLTIPDCKKMCPLENFIRLMENILPKELIFSCPPFKLKPEDMIYEEVILKLKNLFALSLT